MYKRGGRFVLDIRDIKLKFLRWLYWAIRFMSTIISIQNSSKTHAILYFIKCSNEKEILVWSNLCWLLLQNNLWYLRWNLVFALRDDMESFCKPLRYHITMIKFRSWGENLGQKFLLGGINDWCYSACKQFV